MTSPRRRLVTCSFCGKSQAEVKKIIAGPASIYICDRCVGVCAAIIAREVGKSDTPPLPPVLTKSVDDAQKVLFLLRELRKEDVITEAEYRAKARLLVDFKDAGGSQKDGEKVSFSKSKKSNS